MANVHEILDYLFHLAPIEEKESWDYVGLMVGSMQQPVQKILVALDPFYSVCEEAVACGAQLLVTHHPMFFGGARAITDQTEDGRSAMLLIRSGIACISMHTNLDAAVGGVNDCLASRLGLRSCVGLLGKIPGLGRIGEVAACSLPDFVASVKEKLGCAGVRYCDGGRRVHRVAVGGGACADFLPQVAAAGCDTFVTSDVKYNQFHDAQSLGISLIDAGHYWTENVVCEPLLEKLQCQFPALNIVLSQKHTDITKFA